MAFLTGTSSRLSKRVLGAERRLGQKSLSWVNNARPLKGDELHHLEVTCCYNKLHTEAQTFYAAGRIMFSLMVFCGATEGLSNELKEARHPAELVNHKANRDQRAPSTQNDR